MFHDIKNSNIFDADVHALLNPVNCLGVDGAGLAKQFKEQFPWNSQNYHWECSQHRLQIGKVYLNCQVDEEANPVLPYIVNFPSKNHWKEDSSYVYIYRGLYELRKVIADNPQILSYAIPPLGCGLGGLNWKVVQWMIREILKKQAETVEIYLYHPR